MIPQKSCGSRFSKLQRAVAPSAEQMPPFHFLCAALFIGGAPWFVVKAGMWWGSKGPRSAAYWRVPAALAAAVAVLTALTSDAWAACPEQESWARRCETDSFRFEVQACPEGVIVGAARIKDNPELPIELKLASQRSFRRVGETGIQPIGEFPDWNKQPKAQRETLDAMIDCVTRIGPPPLPKPGDAVTMEPKSPRLLAIGLLLLTVALGLRASLTPISSRKRLRRDVVLVCGFALAVALLRWRLAPPAVFHQNGQGPLWVLLALGDTESPQIYGPGYSEVCGWLATRMDPELAVYLINATLFALMIPAAFAIARGVGLGRTLAAMLAGGLALHPLAARLAGSESYYATISGLAMLACLALVLAMQPAHELSAPRRRWLFVTGTLAAAALIAQAARVHPLAWSPLAYLGCVPLCAPAPARRRIIRTAIMCGLIAVVVLGTSVTEMLTVLAGELGQKWLPRTMFRTPLFLAALGLCAVMWLLGRRTKAALPALAFCLVLGLMSASNPLPEVSPRIAHALTWLSVPALLGTFACWLVQVGPLTRTVCCACAVGACLGWGYDNRTSYLRLPTDALEIRAANTWKRKLPDGAYVAYVSRAERRVLFLPLYDSAKVGSARIAPNARSVAATPKFYYYRSSLCSTPEGKDLCNEVEARFELTPIWETTLPAVPSLVHLPLDPKPIRVVLFSAKPRPHHPSDATREKTP